MNPELGDTTGGGRADLHCELLELLKPSKEEVKNRGEEQACTGSIFAVAEGSSCGVL